MSQHYLVKHKVLFSVRHAFGCAKFERQKVVYISQGSVVTRFSQGGKFALCTHNLLGILYVRIIQIR